MPPRPGGKNPLALDVRGNLKGDVFKVDSLRLTQADLIELTGAGSVNLAGDLPVVDGDFRLAKFEFPAAYGSYMQITLATTSVLSDLRTSGSLSGELSVRLGTAWTPPSSTPRRGRSSIVRWPPSS